VGEDNFFSASPHRKDPRSGRRLLDRSAAVAVGEGLIGKNDRNEERSRTSRAIRLKDSTSTQRVVNAITEGELPQGEVLSTKRGTPQKKKGEIRVYCGNHPWILPPRGGNEESMMIKTKNLQRNRITTEKRGKPRSERSGGEHAR